MVDDRSGVLDLEAAGGVGGRKVEQHGIPAPLLSLERQILQEEEVITPPRGGGGGVHLPSLRCLQEGRDLCLRFLRKSDHRMVVWTDGRMDVGSSVNVLVDTVARMQQDLANLRAENRLLRTPGVPQGVRAPRQAAFTMTKVPRFGNNTDRFSMLSCV